MRVILASSSPRRQELMKMFHLPFEVITFNTEEKLNQEKSIYEQCMNIAKEKAKAVFEKMDGDILVIGSDTIVAFNNEIYGKPKDYKDAFNMLKKFSNNKHEVISSLCVLIRKDGHVYEELTYDKCNVYVDEMSDNEINDWIENNDVYTRAGAYAIQDGFAKFIYKIEGDYYSIVGFPVHKLYTILKKYEVI